MCSFNLKYFLIFILNLYIIHCQISDKRLCVDVDCKEQVSLAKTLLKYNSVDPRILSFNQNVDVKIFSKEAGSRTDLWGAEIDGKRGYIPKDLVREHKMFNKPTVLVLTEDKEEVKEVPLDGNKYVEPHKVQQPFEVIDGTTVYTDTISPSSTEKAITSTSSPSIVINQEEPASKQDLDKETPGVSVSSDVNEVLSTSNNRTDEVDLSLSVEDDENIETKHNVKNDYTPNSTENNSLEAKGPISNDLNEELSKNENEIQDTDESIQNKEELNEPTDVHVTQDSETEKQSLEKGTVSNNENKILEEPVFKDKENNLGKDTVINQPVIEATNDKLKNEDVISQIGNITSAEQTHPNNEIKTDNQVLVDETEITKNTANTAESLIKEGFSETPNFLRENILYGSSPNLSKESKQNAEIINVNTENESKINADNSPVVEVVSQKNITETVSEINNQVEFDSVLSTEYKDVADDNSNTDLPNIEDTEREDNSNEIIQDNLQDRASEIQQEEVVTSDDKIEKAEIADSSTKTIETVPDNSQMSQNDNVPSSNFDYLSNKEIPVLSEQEVESGWLSNILALFGGEESESRTLNKVEDVQDNLWTTSDVDNYKALLESCSATQSNEFSNYINFNSDVLLYLITTAISCLIFIFIYLALDRNRREGPLIARINRLEKELLIILKENELLQERRASIKQDVAENERVELLVQQLQEMQLLNDSLELQIASLRENTLKKKALEKQVESLEKELETSTEVGMELNRIISEMLNPAKGSEALKENVEQLQRQLLEQKDIINNVNNSLSLKEAENVELRSELDKYKKLTSDRQNQLDKLIQELLKSEKEKETQSTVLQNEIATYQQKLNDAITREEALANKIQIFKVQLSEAQRIGELKTQEFNALKENLSNIKSIKNGDTLKSLLDFTSMKAQLEQLKVENERYALQLEQEQAARITNDSKYNTVLSNLDSLQQKYGEIDKEKTEINMKLEVLNNYFKKRESELQEEVLKYKSIFDAKAGEATSTTERIQLMQEEIENYKSQNEALKQEIISQEIELKSQISVLEKKVHENWVAARQTERKLEEARQEAAQLRNRLTLRERAINEERSRLQSPPIDQNGESMLSPVPIDSPASPPLLYGGRDHVTKSPPIPGLPPPPFLPPPPGVHFMPPPLPGMGPPFVPMPLPNIFPGDRRPPPLGRMSSPPPLNSRKTYRFSPDDSAFSPYDRNSPSPPYDSEYGASPPPVRAYSPFNGRDDRRDYNRIPHRNSTRNMKGHSRSSGSEQSNDSLDKVNRKQTKMV